MDFPKGWISAGSNEKLWGDAGTYKKVPYEALPPLGGLDGSFAWLRAADESDGMSFEHLEEGTELPLDERVAEVKAAGFTIPTSFVTFFEDPELFTRIPSCTACYYDLGSRLELIPGKESTSRLLRFMNDQQACYLWYLLLHQDGTHEVAVAWPEWKDDPTGDSLEDACTPRDITICAASFEEFIKRFWIENVIWFKASREKPIEGELHAYVEAAASAVARGLVTLERE